MALSNYSDLQTAIATELNLGTDALATAVIQDCIVRAEAKINRRTRAREAEQLSTATLGSSSRYLEVPNDMVELLNLKIKPASSADSAYESVSYVGPERMVSFYSDADWYYTLRDQLEFNKAPSSDHTVQMHYFKKWNLPTDSTNWLMTNYPDIYLYGSLAECEVHVQNDARFPLWKSLFDEAMYELNERDERSRDDAQLDTYDIACLSRGHSFNVLNG